jgi:hypothetical protein
MYQNKYIDKSVTLWLQHNRIEKLVTHLQQVQNILNGWYLYYLLVTMLCSAEVLCGCNVLLNVSRGTVAVSLSELLSRISTPGVETLETCCNGKEWTHFSWFYGAIRAVMGYLNHLIRWVLELSPHLDSLALSVLFTLSPLSLVIIAFWLSAVSTRTCTP